MLAIRLPEETERRLEELAKRTGRTKTFYAREAIQQYLDDLEDYFLAEERLRTHDPKRTVTLEELEREFGLAD